MWTFSVIFFMLVIGTWAADSSSPDDTINITRAEFAKNELFMDSVRNEYIYHMEEDLYKDDGSILFVQGPYLWTTNGKATSTVASGFNTATGFKQLNSTHVVVVDYGYHCLKMVNREDKSNKPFAGTCNAGGFVEGKPGKFNLPVDVELDVNNPGYLLVTDYNNRALRAVEIETGTLSTVTKTGFNGPRGMEWEGEHLLVVNAHYVSKVEWKDNVTVTNTILAGTTSATYTDGDFTASRFYNPHEITRINQNLYLIADFNNGNLRLLDTLQRRVSPVCIDSSTPCTRSTSVGNPTSILKTDNAMYIGIARYIRKLSDYQCLARNQTVYVTPYEERAVVDIDSKNSGVFPAGEYQFRQKYSSGADRCDFFANVYTSPIVRTASFRTVYDVTCATLNNHISKAFLKSVLVHRKNELQKLCGKDCTMSSRLEPWFVCEKDTLTVFWPTDTVFAVDIKDTPDKFGSPLRKKLESSPLRDAEMVILSHLPPYVPWSTSDLYDNQLRHLKLVVPKADKNGYTVSIVLTSKCADKSKTYQESSDTCV